MTPVQAREYLDRIPKDEPVFVLRARDKFAPATIRAWSAQCLAESSLDPKRHAEKAVTREKGRQASILAEEFKLWQESNSSKVKLPD